MTKLVTILSAVATASLSCFLCIPISAQSPTPAAEGLFALLSSTSDVSCYGDSTGISKIVAKGGTKPYTAKCYDKNTGLEAEGVIMGFILGNATFAHLYAGDFIVTITDSSEPIEEVNVEFSIHGPAAPLEYAPNTTATDCFGENSGKIFGIASGGTMPYNYAITNKNTPFSAINTSGTFENIPAGTYKAVVKDDKGCTVTVDSIEVETPEEITVKDLTTKPAAKVVCKDDKTASIKFTVLGRTEPVAPADTAIYYSVKLFSITEQTSLAPTDFKSSNSFHPVFRQVKYCEVTDPETGETKQVPCGYDTLFDKGCHEPTKEIEIPNYTEDKKGFDCNDYITVSGLGKGAYRIEFYRGKCMLGSYKEFTVEQTGDLPKTVKINAIAPICDGSELTVTPEIETTPAISKYKWTLGGIEVGTSKELKHTYPISEDGRILQLTATNACGTVSSNETEITVLPRPTASIYTDKDMLCEGDSTIMVFSLKGTAPFYYTLPDGTKDSTFNATEKVVVRPDASTQYTITALRDLNCEAIIPGDIEPKYITVFDEPIWDFTVTVPEKMVSGRYVTVTATPGMVNYALDLNGENLFPADKLNEFKVKKFPYGTSVNEFTINIEDTNGCRWSAAKSETITMETFPNIFTPNDDGINDIFLKDYYIEVFDRWGTLIYSGSDGWNGKHNGSYVNPGVYLYIVKVDSLEGEELTFKGTVTVER